MGLLIWTIVITAFLIFYVLFGMFISWILPLIIIVMGGIVFCILYLILNQIDKWKLNRIRRKYNEKENESKPGKPGDFGGDFERGKSPLADGPFIERPRTDKLPPIDAPGKSVGRTGKNKKGSKRYRFTPI